jgi:hypothetical protein
LVKENDKLGGEQTVLVVCRGLSEIDFLRRFQPEPGCRYIVASDDLRVHLEMEKHPWVSEVGFLEKMESFYAVALDVIKYLQWVNQWLESLGKDQQGVPRELLSWIRCCEGGKTTQRLQDLLLLIRSYEYLLDKFNIRSIIVLSHPQAKWEDDVLIRVGQSKGIGFRIIGRFRFSILKERLLAWIKLVAREPYYISYIILAKIRGYLRSDQPAIPGKEIVMQLCSPAENHVANILPLMKTLKTRGYSPVALHWRASQAVASIRREGLRAEELETYAPIASLWESPLRVWSTWRQARQRQQEFFTHPELQYHHIFLGPLLWPSVQSFFWEELAQRYRLQQAAQKYFTSHFPTAIRVWGLGVLPEGSIVLKSLKGHQKPLNFFWILNYIDNPYESQDTFIDTDLFLASGDSQKKYLEMLGVPEQRIASVGLSRYDHLDDFKKEFSSSQSRAYLGIPQHFQNYILFDSSYALRGYHTLHEQSLVTTALLNFAREHPSVALMIKPHPAYRPGWLEGLLGYFSLSNAFLINKKMLPYHALNAADLLITKFSTIALEAMLFQKPVISVLLDDGQRFRIYGDAVECADSIETLIEILTKMLKDKNWRAEWVEKQRKTQAMFLKEYFGNNMANSALMAANVLDEFLNKNDEERQRKLS